LIFKSDTDYYFKSTLIVAQASIFKTFRVILQNILTFQRWF